MVLGITGINEDMVEKECVSAFSNVDCAINPNLLIKYLDTAGASESAQKCKRFTFELLKIRSGHHILDVGCGTGDDVRSLAEMVGETGRVVGIDSSKAMVTEARKRSKGLLPIEYRVGDAQKLNFAANSFEACRAERVFVHLSDPRQALVEMVRVTRTGGRIVVIDPDFETVILDNKNQILTRRLLNFACTGVRNGWMGRQLPRLFKETKLSDISIFADTLIMTDYCIANELLALEETVNLAQETNVVSRAEATAWLEDMEQSSQNGNFFAAITIFAVVGQKP